MDKLERQLEQRSYQAFSRDDKLDEKSAVMM